MNRLLRSRSHLAAIVANACLLSGSAACLAQQPPSVARSLAERARQRQSAAEQISPGRIESARQRLVRAVGRLNAYLGTQGANGTAWKHYLKLDDLRAALAASEPADEPLLISLSRFRSDFAGLERGVCLDAASALEQYLRVAGEPARETTAADINQKLAELEKALTAIGETPTREQTRAVGRLLGWFTDRGHEAELATEIREQLGQPNLHVRVSQDLIGSGSIRRINENARPVQDVILGTSIFGVGRTNGWVETRLLPDAGRGLFETTITATNFAETMGYNRSARIATTSVTPLWGTKRYYLDETGFHVWQATSCAQAHSQICGIGSSKPGLRGRIVRHVANKRAGEQKGTAEQIASRHAEQQLNARLDQEANALLGRAHADYLTIIRHPLLRMGQWPRSLRMASTANQLRIDALHDSHSRLAATASPPSLPEDTAMSVEFHESLINSYGEGLFAGRTIQQDDLDKASLELFHRRPKQVKLDETKAAWSMTFTHEDPIVVRIDDGQAWLTIRGRRFRSAERSIDRAMEITVHYFLERDAGAIRARRDGDVVVRSISGRGTFNIADANLIKHRFRDFFTAEITSQGLVLPGQWAKAGRLDLTELFADSGWLSLGWRRGNVK